MRQIHAWILQTQICIKTLDMRVHPLMSCKNENGQNELMVIEIRIMFIF